ncbi:MAG TPA: trigger factor [Ignavibacteria bacterium]|nr:trigger factor [Ignavibacteria bacterium]
MDSKVNVLSSYEHEVEVTLSYDEIKTDIDEAYKKERKNIELPGFRKGKVPMQMLKKVYGEAIEYKASESIAQKKFWDAVDELKLDPISMPQLTDIDFQMGEKLFFKVKYEVKPEVEVKDYKGIEVEKPIFKVKEDDIEREVTNLLKSHSTFQEAEVIVDDKFRITVDLNRLDENGLPVVGQGQQDMLIDLSESNINPAILEGVKDKKVGDDFKFEFIDEHYHGEELHREEFKYSGIIKKIEKIVLPEVTEELLSKISRSKAKTLDEFKQQIRDNYSSYYQSQAENIVTNSLLNKVVEKNDFPVPPGYVETILNNLVESEKENAKRYKTPNFDEKGVREYLKPRAEWTAKWQIIMEAIASKENLKVEDSDLEKLAEEEAEKTGISKEKLVKFYKDSNRSIGLLEEKVINFLKENTKIQEIDAEQRAKEKKDKK